MATFGVLIGLGLLMWMAYRGYSVIFFAPVFALLAAAFSGLPLLPTYTEIFLPNLANYVKTFFPFFLLGAVFGKAMEVSGSAESIARTVMRALGAKRAILAVVLSCAVLTYGGVSLFVVAFAVYPFADSLFREAGIPKRLLPGTIALGAFTFTMDALPGSPQIQNAIPMRFFGTDLYAAPLFGTLGAILVFVSGLYYLERQRKKAAIACLRRVSRAELPQDAAPPHSEQPASAVSLTTATADVPHPALAALPLAIVVGLTLLLQKIVFPRINLAALASSSAAVKFDPHALESAVNNWALIIAVAAGIIAAILLNPRRVKGGVALAINAGVTGALLAVMNTASEVGFGNVIKTLPGFQSIANALMGMRAGSGPLFSEAITVNVLAGVTGSASGGMSIALDAFGKDYLSWAASAGISPGLLHRVAAMASGGMDTLPHNGAVITLLAITGLTHRESYKDIFAITLIKTAAVFALIALNSVVPLG
ncbi:MAG: GntP family permease [Deltaproteobacteria bacterium]|nr:GntP family permease [Deltaproteobacteria bacterium]